ncbi:MAG: glycosyltransferase family 1 protein [Pedosphaera sp.]|nr:glycosyltransferase family 1 protein [Pedosphaera sp.]
MKMLFVHERFGAFAGAEVNVLLTADELKRRGHALALLHGPPTGKSEEAWRELFSIRFAFGEQPSAQAVAEAVQQFSPDCIYVHKLADLGAVEALLGCGRPLARMVHDHDLYCMRSYKYHPLTREICRRPASLACIFPCGAVLARNRGGGLPFKWVSYAAKKKEIALNRRFQRMVVATDYMREELLRNGFARERIEIHSPVPRFDEARETASFSERNLIVFAGQIIRGKGVDVLLEALALVKQPFECVILGDGGHRAACEELSRRLGLESRVKFKGYIPPAEMAAFYLDASVAVVSSVWPEPFGAVGLEAMRYGLPVVAFDAGGIREWLADGKTGFLVPWMDRAMFAERVEQLLEYKKVARQLGAQGREVARENFSFAKYIDGLEVMFGKLIHGAKTPTT